MSVRATTQVGNSVIRTKAKSVKDFNDPQIKKIVQDSTDAMRKHNLVGMAAPQIGESLRIFVSEIRKTKLRDTDECDKLRIYSNPKIVSTSKGMVNNWEGCGSVAHSGIFAKVKRHISITIEAQDEHGEQFTLTAKGLLARVIQHEVDHLDGIVFTDRADMKTVMSQDEYLKMQSK